jgi:glutamate synthase (NADPH) small chain
VERRRPAAGRVISFTNFEIMPKPPEKENKALTWPDWPLKLRS